MKLELLLLYSHFCHLRINIDLEFIQTLKLIKELVDERKPEESEQF